MKKETPNRSTEAILSAYGSPKVMQLLSIPFGLQMAVQMTSQSMERMTKSMTYIVHQLEIMECTNDKKCMIKTKERNFFPAQIKSEP